MSRIMIKEAHSEDSQILARMALEVWGNDSFQALTSEFEEMTQMAEVTSFLAYFEEEAIGFANVALRHDYVEGCDSSPVAYLEGIYVKPPYRRQGYARHLVDACQLWGMEQGCHEFASDCELNNQTSWAFHLAMGFLEVNRLICFKKSLYND